MTIVHLEPHITLLAGTKYYGAPHIQWKPESGSDSEHASEFGGRLCYLSFGKDSGIAGHKTVQGRSDTGAYFGNILHTKHGSVLEHNVFTFLFEGVSRSFTHELVRHRHLSFSQLSQRFVEEKDIGFVVPPLILKEGLGSPVYDIWLASCIQSKLDYRRLLEYLETNITADNKKRFREAARSVLNNAAETKIVVSGNARAWRHFLHLRGAVGADLEIRRVAGEVAGLLVNDSPNIFQDITIKHGTDDFITVEVGSGSV